jgi:RNA polymerase sigma factor (sigma-70 family)
VDQRISTTEGRMPLKDDALARRAAAGDADAFATLYDRYERRAYNLCYRITGSPDDAADATQETFLKVLERLPSLEGRELNFGAYVMTAARNASYDAIERRKRSAPAGEIPESAEPLNVAEDHELPERTALRQAHQEQIRRANQALPERQREVLALRELQDLSYGEVAQIMGMNQNSVAQLISRARINLRDGLRQTALGSVASASPQCDRALPLLAKHQDGMRDDPWLAEHLMDCGACRVRLGAMEEAAVAYRQWLLLVPALWLREETAEAAERVNGGWNRPRGRRMLAGAGATLVLLLALAFLAADGAESPTRAFAPAATPEAEPVQRVAAAPKPLERRVAKKPKKAVTRRRVAKPRAVEMPAPAVEDSTENVVVAAAPTTPVAKPKPAPVKTRPKPRRTPRPAGAVVLADPPPVVVDDPPAQTDTPTTTDPPAPCPAGSPGCPGGTAPTPCTSIRGCQPPTRVTGIVAPTPTAAPPRRVAPVRGTP